MFWFGISQNFYGHSTAKNDVYPESYWKYLSTTKVVIPSVKINSWKGYCLSSSRTEKMSDSIGRVGCGSAKPDTVSRTVQSGCWLFKRDLHLLMFPSLFRGEKWKMHGLTWGWILPVQTKHHLYALKKIRLWYWLSCYDLIRIISWSLDMSSFLPGHLSVLKMPIVTVFLETERSLVEEELIWIMRNHPVDLLWLSIPSDNKAAM